MPCPHVSWSAPPNSFTRLFASFFMLASFSGPSWIPQFTLRSSLGANLFLSTALPPNTSNLYGYRT